MANEIKTEIVVLGGGPGGYTAAFRTADLGKQVVIVEANDKLGGVCLNVGCIPSKALLHAAAIINEAKEIAKCGIEFAAPKIDIDKLRGWKDGIINKLTTGLAGLAKRRKVEVVNGVGKFVGANQIIVNDENNTTIHFEQAIIAAGSEPVKLPFIPNDPRIIDSTGALELANVPTEMLIIGGGIIGLEMATVYAALGSKVSIVEFMPQLIPGADSDLVKPLHRFIKNKYQAIMLETKVTAVEAKTDGLWVTFEGKQAPAEPQRFDSILVAVGRRPNGNNIGAAKADINVDERGFIPVNDKLQTNIPNIYAVGDIIGNPMLAHKAITEGQIVAEVIAGDIKNALSLCPKYMPSVAYTDSEIAWIGKTEKELTEEGVDYGKGVFPWWASGRSLGMGRNEGMTKLLFDAKTEKLLGAGIVGPNAGELISELTLALEIEATAKDIAHTIHPHPTLSETIMMAAEAFLGTITDLYMPKR